MEEAKSPPAVFYFVKYLGLKILRLFIIRIRIFTLAVTQLSTQN